MRKKTIISIVFALILICGIIGVLYQKHLVTEQSDKLQKKITERYYDDLFWVKMCLNDINHEYSNQDEKEFYEFIIKQLLIRTNSVYDLVDMVSEGHELFNTKNALGELKKYCYNIATKKTIINKAEIDMLATYISDMSLSFKQKKATKELFNYLIEINRY